MEGAQGRGRGAGAGSRGKQSTCSGHRAEQKEGPAPSSQCLLASPLPLSPSHSPSPPVRLGTVLRGGHSQGDIDIFPSFSHTFTVFSFSLSLCAFRYRFAEEGIPKEAAYQMIHDELLLDCNPRLNLASFVTTWMEPDGRPAHPGVAQQGLHQHRGVPDHQRAAGEAAYSDIRNVQ